MKKKLILHFSNYNVFHCKCFWGLYIPKTHQISEPRRGDLVVVQAPFYARPAWYVEVADSVVRFFTLQQIGLGAGGRQINAVSVKRVVAVPGDTLSMKGSEVRIRTRDSDHFLTEYEVSGKLYDAGARKAPEGWPESFPLSGSYPEITLEEGEYFVLGDNRTSALDSRAYGPVRRDAFVARVLFRYWPFRDFGRP